MTYTVRPARPDDLDILRGFEQGIVAWERPFDPTIRPDPVSYYDIGEMIEADWAQVLVAEHAGQIVASGYAKRKASRSYQLPAEHAFLGMMFVVPAHRGRGVNGRVLDGLLAWAKEQDLPEIHLTVYPGNESAVNAYLKAGFSPHILEMRMRLD